MFSDAHCDTISTILDSKQDLFENNIHLDLKRIERYNGGLQFYAAWIDPKYEPYSALPRCLDIIDKFYHEAEKNHLHIILKPNDVIYVEENKAKGALLSIEGGSAIAGRLSNLRIMYKLGVRAMTLTWNGRNEIADGVGEGENAGGLSPFGKKVVLEMNRLGMIVDVSHLSNKGFWDVVEVSDVPFIASHSNAKAVCGFRRNLSDEQIDVIVKRNGFIGINLCPDFLKDDGTANISDIIRHIEYFMEKNANNILGFGADFDGIDYLPKGIMGIQDIYKIPEQLLKLGYRETLVNNIMYGNLHRCLKQILKN